MSYQTRTSGKDDIWGQAIKTWRSRLGKAENKLIDSTPNYQALRKSILATRKQYRNHVVPQILDRLDPLTSRLKTFTSALDTFAQADSILTLVWGSLKVVISLATCFHEALLNIVEMFEKIDSCLPRFDIYLKAFPTSQRIETAVLELYSEIIEFSVQSIEFLKKNPIRNLIRAAWSSYAKIFEQSLQQIERLKTSVELEAFAATVEGAVNRHEEIKGLLLSQGAVNKQSLQLPCHVIAFPRNARFFGRSSTLELIKKLMISSQGNSGQRSLAIVGFGGLGKTQVVLEFVWQHLSSFEAILWAQSDSRSKLEQAFHDFGRRLGLIPAKQSSDITQTVELVKAWLESTNVKWLIVFDNVEEHTVLKSFWPVSQRGSVILTARNLSASFASATDVYNIPCFTAEEGSELLLHLLDCQPRHSVIEKPNDHELAKELSSKLGGLALGLAQVAGFVVSSQCTLAEMLEIYKQQEAAKADIPSSEQPVNLHYEHNLDTVWTATFSRMNDRSLFFLGILSFLDPDAIPEEIFAANTDPAIVNSVALFPKSSLEYFEIISQLRTYDLVKRNPDRKHLSMHRLIQRAIIKRMTPSQKTLTLKVLIALLTHVYPRQSLGMAMGCFWEECELFLPQVLAVASHYNHTDGVQVFSRSLAELLHNATWYMQEKGKFEQLLPIVDIATKIIHSIGEEDSLLMGEIYNTLGNVYLEIGNFVKCEENFLKVKEIREKSCPSGHPAVANIFNNLSLAKTALGHFQEAADLSYRVIQMRESLDNVQYQSYKQNTLPINYANLCRILYTMGSLSQAAEMGEKAVELAKQAFGLKSKNTAQAIFNLADVRMKQGHPEALKLHLQALHLRKDVLGRHYSTAGSCYKVSCFFVKEGDLTNAKQVLEDALMMYREAYQAEGGIARTLYKLAEISEKENDAHVAEAMRAEAEAIRRKISSLPLSSLDPASSYDSLVPYMDQ